MELMWNNDYSWLTGRIIYIHDKHEHVLLDAYDLKSIPFIQFTNKTQYKVAAIRPGEKRLLCSPS